MMRLILFVVAFTIMVQASCQVVNSIDEVETIASIIPDTVLKNDLIEGLQNKIDSIKDKPEYYNKVWKFIVERIARDDSSAGRWLNELNVDFKTFQNEDSTSTSLGFSYDLNLERAWIKEKNSVRTATSLAFSAQGNVALKKEVNPNNFLISKLAFNFFRIGGGVFLKDLSKSTEELANMRLRMSGMTSRDSILASDEWKQFNEIVKLKNSWIIKYDLNGGLESNQDFSKHQTTIGIRVGGGVKSWNQNDLLSKLNILDYPFALLRSLTGFEKGGVLLYGSTIPVLLVGFDYVNPGEDVTREGADSELKPFPRINFELGFRTIVGKASSQILYFNSSFRYYSELGASSQIKTANLDQFRYFTASITSSSGLFISYTYGQLPFDRKNEQVYQLGFNYKLN